VGEAWFAIAYQFLAHDARAQEARRDRAQVLPFVLPAAGAAAAGGQGAAAGMQADAAAGASADANAARLAAPQPLRAQA